MPAARLRIIRGLLAARKSHDVVVLQKVLPSGIALRLLRRWARVLVWECDDAVHLGYPGSSVRSRRRAKRRFALIRRHADVVTTSNPLLADELRPRSGSTIWFPGPAPEPRIFDGGRERLVVWLGSPSTQAQLELIRGAVAGLASAGWECVAVGADRDDLGWTPVGWSSAAEFEYLSRASVGVLPQLASNWNDRKAGYKILEYCAAGIVPVASDVLPARVLMGESELRRFLVPNDQDRWLQAIQLAAASRDSLRNELAELCRQHSPASVAARWIDAVEAVV